MVAWPIIFEFWEFWELWKTGRPWQKSKTVKNGCLADNSGVFSVTRPFLTGFGFLLRFITFKTLLLSATRLFLTGFGFLLRFITFKTRILSATRPFLTGFGFLLRFITFITWFWVSVTVHDSPGGGSTKTIQQQKQNLAYAYRAAQPPCFSRYYLWFSKIYELYH